MNESKFWQSLRRYINSLRDSDTVMWRVADAQPGMPDVLWRIDNHAGLMELKYRREWPKRWTTPIRFAATPQQILKLKDWRGTKGRAFGLLGVANEWFLLDVPWIIAYHKVGRTRSQLYDEALAHGHIGGKKWAGLIEALIGPCAALD